LVRYDVTPEEYRHWTLVIEPPVATLTLVAGVGDDGQDSGGFGGLLSSLLRADIELADAVQRLRFECPDVGAVVVTGSTDRAFSTIAETPAGAAPEMAATVRAFRDEVRCAIEDASANSGQHWLAALTGPAAGPGYELALACDEIVLVDDGRSAVSLPASSGGGDLAASGGLIRLLDKRHVRPDLVDTLCCCPEGVSGQTAVDWGLVDHIAAERCFTAVVHDRAMAAAAARKPRGPMVQTVELGPLWCEDFEGGFAYPNVRVELEGDGGAATLTIVGPPDHECFAPEPGPRRLRSRWWPLAVCRELDDALLRLRSLRPSVDTLVLRTEGDPLAVASADVAMTTGYEQDCFVREVVLYWKRTLKRLDFAWQSVIALIEPGSCFVGTLLELALAADRAYMVGSATLDDAGGQAPEVVLTGMNFGPLPQANGLTRLESRFLTRTDHLGELAKQVGDAILATEAAGLGLITEAVLEADWEETIRRAVEARGMLPFATRIALAATRHTAGTETLESKILSRRGLR
jgi:benzoyl-CoA-dihydrodiol lyase